MNKLFLLFIFIASMQFTHAQVTDKSKQKSEMQQAVDDLKKEISDLEAEIKIAEKADPDEAAELKNELAMLKKMLSNFDKTSNPATQPTKVLTTNISSPKTTASSIVPVSLKQPVFIPTAAQAKDKLLWYRGKKINDTTLVTVKGMVVQFNKKKNEVVLQPQKKADPFDKIVQEFTKGEQRKSELIDRFDKMENGFMFYPELKNGLALFDDITERWNSVLKNTVELPVLPMPVSATNNPDPGKIGSGPSADLYSYDDMTEQNENEQLLKEMKLIWEQELARAKKEIKELPPVSEFPAPPMHELGICSLCDTSLIRKQRIQDSIWRDKYWGKETRILQRILGVERQKELLGVAGEGIFDVIDTLFIRGVQKNKILYEKYGNDMRCMNIIAEVLLGSDRQIQLLGGSERSNDSFLGIQTVAKSFKLYNKYLDEQIEAKNHDFVLNIASHLGNERMKQLLADSSDLNELLEKFLNYNRFALTIDLDFIIEQRNNKDELQFKATGAMSTKEKVYGMLVSDSCIYRMIQYNTDLNNAQLNDVSIPLIVKSGIKTIRNEDNKLEDFSYTGPESFQLLFPDVKIEFCSSNNPDSAFFATLMGDEVAANMYMGNLNNNIKNYKTDFLGFANLALLNTDVGKNKTTMGNLSAEMMTTISSFQNQNSGGSKIDKLKMQYEGKRQMDSYKKNMQSQMNDKKSILLFYANNRSTVLVDKYEDTKRKLYDDFNLTRGLIHLRVIHDPVK